MPAFHSLPSGWLPRAGAASRVALSLGKAAAKRVIARSDPDDRALGEALVGELDRLKGLSMKVGQILSTMDVGLPDETVAVLARLQRGAQPMAWEVLRGELERALGGRTDDLFDTFDTTPVASASIGQVHRATLGGAELAVKVRYPGVLESLESDTQSLTRVASLASLATVVDGRALVNELQARLFEECDYRREGAWLTRVDARLAAPGWSRWRVAVPGVVPERCAESVLTTRWVDGLRFEALQQAPLTDRVAVGRTLLGFAWESMLAHHFVHADPHPGNYVFPAAAEGSVVLLDWGSVRLFTPAEIDPLRALLRCVIDGDRASFRSALVDAGVVPDPRRYDFDAGWAMFRWMWAPYLESRFAFTPAWSVEGRRFNGPSYPNQRHQAFPPAWICLFRVTFGTHTSLVRLEVSLDARDGLESALDAPVEPMLADPSDVRGADVRAPSRG